MTEKQLIAKCEKTRKAIMDIAKQMTSDKVGKVCVHCTHYYCKSFYCSLTVSVYDANDKEQICYKSRLFGDYSEKSDFDIFMDEVEATLNYIKTN